MPHFGQMGLDDGVESAVAVTTGLIVALAGVGVWPSRTITSNASPWISSIGLPCAKRCASAV